MHKHFIKVSWIIRKVFPAYIWRIPVADNSVFLTFDDGPHPSITHWVLDELKKYQALATFFCIGENVVSYPDTYERILQEGHAVGNHTYDHPNGWETATTSYLENITKASRLIQSHLFRPPYGRITKEQAKGVGVAMQTASAKIIMWEVLSADFDPSFSPQQCLNNVLKNVRPGSIVVFHDSERAFPNLEYALPIVLQELRTGGYDFKKIDL